MLLILDSPRAADGMNHRYFLPSTEGKNGKMVEGYSNLARKLARKLANAPGCKEFQGEGFLGISRSVTQVTNRQFREGPELLILGGVGQIPTSTRQRVFSRMRAMLEKLPDAPIAVPKGSEGMLFAYPPLALLENELRGILGERVSGETTCPQEANPVLRWNRVRNAVVFLVAVALVAVAWALFAWQQSGTGGTSDPAPRQGEAATGGEDEKPGDWSFLGNDDSDWSDLARFTGFPGNGSEKEKNLWARNLMREMKRDEESVSDESLPHALQNDEELIKLRAIINRARAQDGINPCKVARAWLSENSQKGGRGVNDLWDAVNERGERGNEVSARKLRVLLSSWHAAAKEFAPDKAVLIPSKPVGKFLHMDILTPLDLTRFNETQDAFLTPGFLDDAKKTGFGFESSEWNQRLLILSGMKDLNGVTANARKFAKAAFEALSAATAGNNEERH